MSEQPSNSRNIKLSVKNLYKVFGDSPKEALELLEQGVDKDEIFRRTRQTVGVQKASFDIFEGEIFVIMGLSGSGKSTLVRLLNRLIEPTSGEIMIDGEEITSMDIAKLRQIRRDKISMVFQSFALMPHMNILDNAAFGLELGGADKTTRHTKAQVALEQVGLADHGQSYPDELSGGMQQRVGLARALANDPAVMLMDEAFSALDPLIRTEMQDELLRLQSEQSRTIVFISHDLDEAMRIGDRIAIMQGGVIVQIGTPDEILYEPANDYVRSFFRGVDVGGIFTAGHIASKQNVTVIRKEDGGGTAAALQRMRDYDREYGYVLDKTNRFQGVVSLQSLHRQEKQKGSLDGALLENIPCVSEETPLNEIIGDIAKAPCPLPVVGASGKYLGTISKATLLEALDYTTEEVS